MPINVDPSEFLFILYVIYLKKSSIFIKFTSKGEKYG